MLPPHSLSVHRTEEKLLDIGMYTITDIREKNVTEYRITPPPRSIFDQVVDYL